MSATAPPAAVEESPADCAESDSKLERLRTYLAEETADQGELYVKGKFIADDVDMSPQAIGQLMIRLQESAPDLEIEKWSYTSATTWRVTTAQSA
ncbi:hypothetical protein OB920_05960 [Halobacteria archaeon HArc-gm2]|nr:hypothetical protein [Halobacteria archaeon HArc-gm2]